MEKKPLPMGIKLLGTSLVAIGGITIVMLGAVFSVGRDAPTLQVLLSLLYGAAALTAGWALLRQMTVARVLYLIWCAVIGAYLLMLRDYVSGGSIPGLLVLVLVLGLGYRYIAGSLSREG